jgi:hypothetical protein
VIGRTHDDLDPRVIDPSWFRVVGSAVYGALWIVIIGLVRPVDWLLRWRQ